MHGANDCECAMDEGRPVEVLLRRPHQPLMTEGFAGTSGKYTRLSVRECGWPCAVIFVEIWVVLLSQLLK